MTVYRNSTKNLQNNFRKARIEGEYMLKARRITFDDFTEIMRGFEADLKNAGVTI